MNSALSWDIEVLAEAASTQDLVKARADEGGLEGFGIQALSQNAGYGRHGRSWIGLEDNLFLSFILRPNIPAEEAGQMALVVGEALAETVRVFVETPELVSLKWPNDVLIGGQKCAGILIESRLRGETVEWLVVGVGVNLTAAPEGPFTALSAHSEQALDVTHFRDKFLSAMSDSYSRWQTDGFEAIRAHWKT
jgi:BirA family biotin operon repressor/biotin-[acetyl-CoA-carboxylase] ligase